MKLSTIDIALVATFAAFQALLSIFPFVLTVGVSGQITLGVIGGPLMGILLGPIVGGMAALIGSAVGVFLNPGGAIFGAFSIIPPFLGALGAGCLKIKRGYVAGAAMLGSLIIFYAHPSGREAYFYPWLHIIAIFVAFSPLAYYAASTFSSRKMLKPVLGIVVAAFIGILADHISGSALAIWYFSPVLTAPVWNSILLVYPVERLVAVGLASAVTIPVYSSLKKARLLDYQDKT